MNTQKEAYETSRKTNIWHFSMPREEKKKKRQPQACRCACTMGHEVRLYLVGCTGLLNSNLESFPKIDDLSTEEGSQTELPREARQITKTTGRRLVRKKRLLWESGEWARYSKAISTWIFKNPLLPHCRKDLTWYPSSSVTHLWGTKDIVPHMLCSHL